ncbi:MAG: hypothetical protein H6642_13870 [Caldilineaceae bacterium]|nr:hypothetical protein [Caldilineaceae bacterium]
MTRRRLLLLTLILVAFTRLLVELDAVNLWWDESLSLQRAESSWPDLLLGNLPIGDGVNQIVTRDQHPFAYFALLRAFRYGGGLSEFGLRLPAAFAAVLLVPALWSLARLLERRGIALAGTAWWVAGLAALSPFHLWFGQEVRMYAQVAVLAPLSFYWLLRWTRTTGGAQWRAAGWAGLFTLALLLTHYFAVYLLPVYIGVFALHVYRRNRAWGAVLFALLSAGAFMGGLLIARQILSQPGAGANFAAVELDTLIKDLLNAFSFGPGVAIDRVWLLDLLFGVIALIGCAAAVRNRRAWRNDGWTVGALLLGPPLALWIVNRFLPSYMTARHMAIISGFFLLAVAAGVAWLGSRRREVGLLLGGIAVGCLLYANGVYYTRVDPRTTDFAGLGETLAEHLQPGDVVLLQSPEFKRMYEFYLPDELDALQPRADDLVWQIVPVYTGDPADTEARLTALHAQGRRIWSARIAPLITDDFDGLVDKWLADHAFLVKEYGFTSENSFLKMTLYLPEPTVFEADEIAQAPGATDADFGGIIRLRGLDADAPLIGGRSLPIALYWEPLEPIRQRYKYILRLEIPDAGGSVVLAQTEREPYEGAIATAYWQDPGKTILEYSELTFSDPVTLADIPGDARIALQLYDMETGAKLPVTNPGAGKIGDDGATLYLPFVIP